MATSKVGYPIQFQRETKRSSLLVVRQIPALQLAARFPSLLLLRIPQEAPEDLAGGRLRDLINELDASRDPLVSCLVLLNILLNFASDNAIVLLDANRRRLDDKRLGNLARCLVGNLDDRAVGNGWVGEKMRLELRRCDLVALQLN
jgi:hypothetical protein